MRILLLQPEDSLRLGLWTEQRWDLVVDLGKCSDFSEGEWAEHVHCRLVRGDSFLRGLEDARLVRKLFQPARGRLLDEEGIDWWDLTFLHIAPRAEALHALRRLAAEISPAADLWATRPGWPASALSWLLHRPLRSFSENSTSGLMGIAKRYKRLFHRLPVRQINQIFFDKYDAGYRWRSRFAVRKRASSEAVVLLPSAYSNVSRMAGDYARLLPEQSFLLIATRHSALQFEPPPNVGIRKLAAYARRESPDRETAGLLSAWEKLKEELCKVEEFEILFRAGFFRDFPRWFRDGLHARDAWREAIEREPVCAILCGDDSNLYTRLPVLLAAKRKIPTVDFHHGAFDGRYLLKDLPCDAYLAKNEMERDYLLRVCGLPGEKVTVGAPHRPHPVFADSIRESEKTSIIFFSEPYEIGGLRTEEVYREILPPLCRVARKHRRKVILKLHPFESLAERRKLLDTFLPPTDRKTVVVRGGPLTNGLLSSAWFGMTVQSSTVLDCTLNGIACFLCEWLASSPYGYVQQFGKFAVGHALHDASEIETIPQCLPRVRAKLAKEQSLWQTAPAEMLSRWLTPGRLSAARQAS